MEFRTFDERLLTFAAAQPAKKRRTSSQTSKAKKKDATPSWPLKTPTIEELARAGFYYFPTDDAIDNVKCFQCGVTLDGWEETDDPAHEHLAHSEGCKWAHAISVAPGSKHYEDHDPLTEEMITIRKSTFEGDLVWPHEAKKGWKCKVNKMVDAGWAWNPTSHADDEIDCVTCFYCDKSLGGWEPKDDPFVEHIKRSPECRFFELLNHYHGTTDLSKIKKLRGRNKASVRSSNASKTSRASIQSTRSEVDTIALDSSLLDGDESILSSATTLSNAAATGGKKTSKKAGKAKPAAKTTRSRKKDTGIARNDDEDAATVENTLEKQHNASLVADVAEAVSTSPTRETKTKTTRAKKTKPKKSTESQLGVLMPTTPDAATIAKEREDAAILQLQEELEHSIDITLDSAQDESTPIAQVTRGTKRSSDGQTKQSQVMSSFVELEFPVPPRANPVQKKITKARKPKQNSAASNEEESQPPAAKIKTGRKQTNGRPKKTSQSQTGQDPDAGLELSSDEEAIERELEQIAAENEAAQQVLLEQEKTAEFEPSPSHAQTSTTHTDMRRREDIENVDDSHRRRMLSPPPQRSLPLTATPSPSNSDKENQPSSVVQASHTKQLAAQNPTSPRIPLAPGTPNRSLQRAPAQTSPSKLISHLNSTHPWTAVDLDTILLPSPQPTPNRLTQRLAQAAGELTSPEKKMTIEEWIRHRAGCGENDLRARCEEMVGAFERQGLRALESLGGLTVD